MGKNIMKFGERVRFEKGKNMGHEETYYKRKAEVAEERNRKLERAIGDLAIELANARASIEMINGLLAEKPQEPQETPVGKLTTYNEDVPFNKESENEESIQPGQETPEQGAGTEAVQRNGAS